MNKQVYDFAFLLYFKRWFTHLNAMLWPFIHLNPVVHHVYLRSGLCLRWDAQCLKRFYSFTCTYHVWAPCKNGIPAVRPTLRACKSKTETLISTCLRSSVFRGTCWRRFGRWFVTGRDTAGSLTANLGQCTSLSTSCARVKSLSHASSSHYWRLCQLRSENRNNWWAAPPSPLPPSLPLLGYHLLGFNAEEAGENGGWSAEF